MGATRRGIAAFAVAISSLLTVATIGVIATPELASADVGDYGFEGPSFDGSIVSATSDKPQSKLWYVGDTWYGSMFDGQSDTWHIFRLDRASQQWIDTGVPLDDRPGTLADTLWDGTHLYVASHVVTASTADVTFPSQPNSPARLYRYSYDPVGGTFALDAGFPTVITDYSSESLTIDKDSTGTIWATWTQVTGSSSSGYTNRVYVNSTSPGTGTWGAPFILPVGGTSADPDDISAIVSFGGNRIGVVWSNQNDDTVYWAARVDGSARTTWAGGVASQGEGYADDHLNLKSLQADANGRLYAALKTSLDDGSSGADQVRLLVYTPSTGQWTTSTFGTVADCHTRPMVMLDETNQRVHVFATGPTASGCAFSGAAGTVYWKSAPMSNPVFPPGRGTPVIRDASNATVNDPSSTKQSVNATSGLIVVASNTSTRNYWHADVPLTTPPPAAPTASFTSTVTTGVAPLTVQFTDTSTGSPTGWAWNFGDGGTATTQNPSRTYTTAGTYTVTLQAANAAGTSAPATATVVVSNPTPPAGGAVAARSSTSLTSDGSASVTIARPAGVVAGDVLIAQISSDGVPTMTTTPAGWTPVLTSPLSVSSGLRLFAYSYVVGEGTVPSSFTWQLSQSKKWAAGITAFTGVDTSNVFDGTVRTVVSTSTRSTVTVPSVTTTTAGAMVVSAVGIDSGSVTVSPPTGWTEAWEVAVQSTALAHQGRPNAGATGNIIFGLSKAMSHAGWAVALRPATTPPPPPPPPAAPTASFTTNTTTGVAPLTVQFTDTSTGTPTAWAWNLGDGGTATTQNPSRTYTTAGTYTVTLQATNAGGTSTPATTTITVTNPPPPPAAPTASFTTNTTTGVAPLTVQFTDTSTGTPTAWAWNLGDGTTATTQNPSRTYTTAGTYTVTLQATNAGGTSTPATTTITVTNPPPPPAAPTASFTTNTTTGVAPLTVQFTDTSTGTPTAWAWNLGDGGTATTQNPSRTYTTAGTYTVTLQATNAGGTSTPATTTITVTNPPPPPPPPAGVVTAKASTSLTNAGSTSVTIPRPAGIAAGDVLIAHITADGNPTITAPTGWTSVLTSPLSVGSGVRVFVYHYVVGDVAATPASWTWPLSTAKKWGAGMTAFAGVDTTNVFDAAARTVVSTSARSTVTVPGVTTTTPGAMLVGGVGIDSGNVTATPPTGWTEAFEVGVQTAELAYQSQPDAGATGNQVWRLSTSMPAAGWLVALRPATG